MKKIMKLLLAAFIIFFISCSEKSDSAINTATSKEVFLKDSTITDETVKVKTLSKETKELVAILTDSLRKHPELNKYNLYTEVDTFFVTGDFYGDKTEDIALLIKDEYEVKLCIINYGLEPDIKILGNKQKWDSLNVDDFSWVGEFRAVKKGETLWSNYIDDFRNFEDVPESEKVQLDYDALFVHQSESCGGGFIFWKDGKFNWLQQE